MTITSMAGRGWEVWATDWQPYPYYGNTAYRILHAHDGFRHFQRHEWWQEDGSIRRDAWIPTLGFGSAMKHRVPLEDPSRLPD